MNQESGQPANRNENEELKSLREQLLVRDTKIIHLSQRISELTVENKKLREETNKSELILKSRNHALHEKNIQIASIEQKMAQMEAKHSNMADQRILQKSSDNNNNNSTSTSRIMSLWFPAWKPSTPNTTKWGKKWTYSRVSTVSCKAKLKKWKMPTQS